MTTPRRRRRSPEIAGGHRFRLVLSRYDPERRYYRPYRAVRFLRAGELDPLWRLLVAALEDALAR